MLVQRDNTFIETLVAIAGVIVEHRALMQNNNSLLTPGKRIRITTNIPLIKKNLYQ